MKLRPGLTVIGFLLASHVSAVWTATVLHDPVQFRETRAHGAGANVQVGYTKVSGGLRQAARWNSSINSWTSLAPNGSTQSSVYGASGTRYVGSASINGVAKAILWSGVGSEFVVLNSWGDAQALGIHGNQQVGYIAGSVLRAVLWSGTAESLVSLHPDSVTESAAFDTDGVQQVGWAKQGSTTRAALWTGTASSFVDLDPDGQGQASAVSGGFQYGYTRVAGEYHAVRWQGAAGTMVDLNPAGSTNSQISDADVGVRVGSANPGGNQHAALWSGENNTYFDLHSVLPSTYQYSIADSVYSDSTGIYVSGSARTANNLFQAVTWYSPVPEPTSVIALGLGFVGVLRRRRSP